MVSLLVVALIADWLHPNRSNSTRSQSTYKLSFIFFENKVLSQQKDAHIAANQEWNILRDPDLSQASYVLSESAIIEYNWPQQTLVLQNPWADGNQKTPFWM